MQIAPNPTVIASLITVTLLVPAILMSPRVDGQSTEDCTLYTPDGSSLLTCHYKMQQLSSGSQLMRINGCSTRNSTLSCDVVAQTKNVCLYELEVTVYARHKDFLKNHCKEGVHVHLILRRANLTDANTKTKLFDDNSVVATLSVIEMPLNPTYAGQQGFSKLSRIEYTESTFDQRIPRRTFSNDILPSLQSVKLNKLTLPGISRGAFVLGPRFNSLELRELILPEQIESSAIIIKSVPDCSSATERRIQIGMHGSQLIASNLEQDFITASFEELNCEEPLLIELSVTGNSFEKSVPESLFKNFVAQALTSRGVKLSFHFDPIDCCFATNKWLFDLAAEHDSSGLNITCLDLGTSMGAVLDRKEREEVCYGRNAQPILIIGIVAVVLLAILLSVFSFVCIYYVLPKRNQAIMIRDKKTAYFSSDSMPGGSSRETRKSSRMEATSTRTDLAGAGAPLFSVLKKSPRPAKEPAPVQAGAAKQAQQHEDQKTMRSEAIDNSKIKLADSVETTLLETAKVPQAAAKKTSPTRSSKVNAIKSKSAAGKSAAKDVHLPGSKAEPAAAAAAAAAAGPNNRPRLSKVKHTASPGLARKGSKRGSVPSSPGSPTNKSAGSKPGSRTPPSGQKRASPASPQANNAGLDKHDSAGSPERQQPGSPGSADSKAEEKSGERMSLAFRTVN